MSAKSKVSFKSLPSTTDLTSPTKQASPAPILSINVGSSSFIILIGMALTSINLTPINLYFHFVGVVGWLIVGFMWHDRALMVVNSVASMIFLMGILNYYFGGAY